MAAEAPIVDPGAPAGGALAGFSAPVRAWFDATFAEPTPAQAQGWGPILAGDSTLILAPTGSGKTLAAFLAGIDRLMTAPPVEDRTRRTRLVYLSPLRALAVDVEKNLRAPLGGIAHAAERLGETVTLPTVGMRTGDTPANERRSLIRRPPDLLITTPESLYLMLTSSARETLQGVEAVIVDEIHALAPTKRGAHLALSLERLEQLTERPVQRIGLSATQRPLTEIARFLGGHEAPDRPRPVTIVDAGVRKPLDLRVVVPVEDMAAPADSAANPTGHASIWPAIHPRILELVHQHRSTIIFVNARRLAERLAARLNELDAGDDGRGGEGDGRSLPSTERPLVKAHHGSLSREQRLQVEDELKRGELRGLVATSSLELGIDMGAVDLVIQVESPGSVASGLQRVGRAGHQVGEPSRGVLFPKHRADLLEAAVVVQRMNEGLIEHTRVPRNPLDVLAQQIVAMVALEPRRVDEIATVVRGAANFAELSDEVLANVLEMLAGRYPSDEFGELRPRIVWDRTIDSISARPGAQRLAVTNPGTIPDRGLYGVFLPDGTRVGELDEEMVYESRPGETFLLGASTWRIEEITFDRVVVTPAPGQPGKMPFWHGDGPGRPLELGRAVGAFTRELRVTDRVEARERLQTTNGLDGLAADNLLAFLDDQAAATGVVPDDRTVVVERFRDEIGDWRVCVLTPFGARVHAPWAIALRARLADEWGVDPEIMWSDDGIVLRLPDAVEELPVDLLALPADEVRDLVVGYLHTAPLFSTVFREAAARALLLPRRRPDRRTPLWQQRQRAADLLGVARRYPDFPILLESTRECLDDLFDVPALREVLTGIAQRTIRLVGVDTASASPMAESLLFAWVGVYMYAYDAPLAERRAMALSLDRDLLTDLLGAEELRELIDPEVLAGLEADLQRRSPKRRARDHHGVHDLLRELGPLSTAEVRARCGDVDDGVVEGWLTRLVEERRAFAAQVAGTARWVAAEDAARVRDALGTALPPGLPAAYTEPVAAPLADLVSRHARTNGPFLTGEVARRLGVGSDPVQAVLRTLEAAGRVVQGELRPGGVTREWCDAEVLRQLRRRSLAALRREIEPVDAAVLGRFVPSWQGVGGRRVGPDAVAEVVGMLAGAAIPASVLEREVLPTRVPDYRPADLDALCAAGEVVWVGAGALGRRDGRVRLCFREQAPLLLAPWVDAALGDAGAVVESADDGPAADEATVLREALRSALGEHGALFWPDLVAAAAEAGCDHDDAAVLDAIWDLVWAGVVTNDSLAPVRALGPSGNRRGRSGDARGGAARRRPRVGGLRAAGPPAASGRWSLVAPLLTPVVSATEQLHAMAAQLLERHGVVTRETVLAEGVPGGFAVLYPVLRALEERGHVRRGYFVAGLGGAQFALPGAVDRLRAAVPGGDAAATDDDPVVLAATDPAQPYGAVLPWPASAGRPARVAGAHVVLWRGSVIAWLDRAGTGLWRFDTPALDGVDPAVRDRALAGALAGLVTGGRRRKLELRTVDGAPSRGTALAEALVDVGFADGYRGMVLAP